jgi:hypothetical protein
VTGIETAARKQEISTLGTALDAAAHVVISLLRGAAVWTVSFTVVGPSQKRFALQKEKRL